MLWDPKKDRSHDSLALLAAADYIEYHGWCQGIITKGGRVCIMGALQQTFDKDFWHLCALSRRCLKFTDGLGFATWNDVKGRTKKQVIDKLREIAQHL